MLCELCNQREAKGGHRFCRICQLQLLSSPPPTRCPPEASTPYPPIKKK